jgi:5-methylcytosine-specific restriction enzyme B
LNRNIGELKDKDYQIGHSYFIGKEPGDLPEILNGKVIPLLEEYFFGDQNKIREVFANVPLAGGSSKTTFW